MKFATVDHAMRFAFAIKESPICKIANYEKSDARGRSELTPHDLHAQGTMIFQCATRSLDGIFLAYMIASYAHGKPKAAAIRRIAGSSRVAYLHDNRALMYEITKRYFYDAHQRRSQKDISEQFGIRQQKISELERAK